jgi:phosphatidylinositol alpha-1,6-mannosyltransferase
MRLLFISTEFPPGPGGLGTHAYQVAKNLKTLGWNIQVLTVQDFVEKKLIEAFNEAQDFPIISLKRSFFRPFTAVMRFKTLREFLKRNDPDILLASGDSAILLAAPLARIHRKPLAVVTHGRVPYRWEQPLWRWSYNQANALICVSNYTCDRMSSMGIRPAMTKVITNGADQTLFKPLPEQEVHEFRRTLAPENARILLTVGLVSQRKAQDVVIRALPRVLQDFPNTHYFAVGAPQCRTEFMEIAQKLGVSEHVHFPGIQEVSSVVRYINSCDVHVMVSRHTKDQWEGYGIAVLEAALCGKASIVSADSGVRETILPGKTGLTVPEEDVDATAGAIIELLKNDSVRTKMGESARSNALQSATWIQQVRKYDELLKTVASRSQILHRKAS